jgi:predicted methyltransferase
VRLAAALLSLGLCASAAAQTPPITLLDATTQAERDAIDAKSAEVRAHLERLGKTLPRTNYEELQKEAKADKAIRMALGALDRSTDSVLRDDARLAAMILKQTGAQPGMRVLDVGSGGGYLALLLSSMVGPAGHVDIHNTYNWINQFPSMDPEAEKKRIKRANIGWITAEWNDIPREPKESYDIIVLGQVFHDVGLEMGSYEQMCATFFDLLKPGGRLVIEDHDALDTMSPAQQMNLHRLSISYTTDFAINAGFNRIDTILIDSKYDDRRFNVFRPGVRGRTDRYVVTFEKPKG